MPIYLKDLVANPHILDLPEDQKPKFLHDETCKCEDCYYEKLGAEIENHPIVSAGIRRS